MLFKTQELLDSSINKESHYFLLYDNPNAEPAKSDPEKVYLFHDDFSTQSSGKWQNSSWGSVQAVNGLLEVKTNFSPKIDDVEVVVYAKQGCDWQDVNVELDMMETTSNAPRNICTGAKPYYSRDHCLGILLPLGGNSLCFPASCKEQRCWSDE